MSDLHTKTVMKFQWKILYQHSVPLSEMTAQLTVSKFVHPLMFCSNLMIVFRRMYYWWFSFLLFLFPFFSFSHSPHDAISLSFLLLLTFLTQSCFLFRNSQAGVNKNFLSFRVHGDYWVPEVHLVPLDNLYVWSVLYLAFLEEKMKVHWKLLVFLLFVAGHCRYWWTFRPKGKHGE